MVCAAEFRDRRVPFSRWVGGRPRTIAGAGAAPTRNGTGTGLDAGSRGRRGVARRGFQSQLQLQSQLQSQLVQVGENGTRPASRQGLPLFVHVGGNSDADSIATGWKGRIAHPRYATAF